MKRELFNFIVPEHLIAQTPSERRDGSRLFVANAHTQQVSHARFVDLPEILAQFFNLTPPHSTEHGELANHVGERTERRLLVVANDSRVYPARVRIQRKSGARGEVFLLETGDRESYRCLLRPLKKLNVGETLYADGTNIPLFCVEDLQEPRVSPLEKSLVEILEKFGEMPLPPYIKSDPLQVKRDAGLDKERYQTVYNNQTGSAAAPTAGLHFTPDIIASCKAKGIDFSFVTLHVGLGTFAPVQTDNVADHPMHEEFCSVPFATAQLLCEHLEKGWPIAFVGTTSLRTVESFFRKQILGTCEQFNPNLRSLVQARAKEGSLRAALLPAADAWFGTRLFVRPEMARDLDSPTGFERVNTACADALITNFHQPESTLAMLVAALVGYDFWKEMYGQAVAENYRFFSYGDSSLLLL